MSTTNALTRITEQPELDQIAEPLRRAVRGMYEFRRTGRSTGEKRCTAAGSAIRCILNGPSAHDQPCLVVRERDGRIEVKAAD